MGWRKILKSSRDEAYEVFLQEFGPEVDLNSLEVNTKRGGYSLEGNEWVVTKTAGGVLVWFYSTKYYTYIEFVRGMFMEEYPERYKKISDWLQRIAFSEGSDSSSVVLNPKKMIKVFYKALHDNGIFNDMDYKTKHGLQSFPNFILDALGMTIENVSPFKRTREHTMEIYESKLYFHVKHEFLSNLYKVQADSKTESNVSLNTGHRTQTFNLLLNSMFHAPSGDFTLTAGPPFLTYINDYKSAIEKEKR